MRTNLHLIASDAAALASTPVVVRVHIARGQFDHVAKWCDAGTREGAEGGLESQ